MVAVDAVLFAYRVAKKYDSELFEQTILLHSFACMVAISGKSSLIGLRISVA